MAQVQTENGIAIQVVSPEETTQQVIFDEYMTMGFRGAREAKQHMRKLRDKIEADFRSVPEPLRTVEQIAARAVANNKGEPIGGVGHA